MDAYQAFYELVTGLVGMITRSSGLWRIVGPFVMLFVVLRVIRWAFSSARGEKDYDDLRYEGEESADRLRATYMAAQREWGLRGYHSRAGFRRAREDYYQGMRRARRRP